MHYVSYDEDSARWNAFAFRPGDVVISTRSKSGTTWMQMVCLSLVLGTAELPEPLPRMSPWLDHLVTPLAEVVGRLDEQPHRRVIKTHTPLDGLPWRDEVYYVVVARHPLDMAVSLYHQMANIDRVELARRVGKAAVRPRPQPALADWLARWIERDSDPRTDMDGLPGVLAHLNGAWQRRERRNLALVHYDALCADLEGEMSRLAAFLGVVADPGLVRQLAGAASFSAMRSQAARLVEGGVLRSPEAFFRRGSSGAGREVLSADQYARYLTRAAELAPADLLSWLHR